MAMEEFIKIPLTKEMRKDYEECTRLLNEGSEKDCDDCAMSGGNQGCIADYQWCTEV